MFRIFGGIELPKGKEAISWFWIASFFFIYSIVCVYAITKFGCAN
jgi:hypothetical protein